MATQAIVGIKDESGYTVITVNYDGYLSYMGKLLLGHYDTDKVKEMLSLGAASYLGENLDSPNDKTSNLNRYSEFYVRDRSESEINNRAFTTDNTSYLFDHFKYIHNFYIIKDGVWYHAFSDKKFSRLTEDYIGGKAD